MKKLSITCPNCGKLNPRDATECSNCGHKLTPVSTSHLQSRWEKMSHKKLFLAGTIAIVAVIIFIGGLMTFNQVNNYRMMGMQRIKVYNTQHHYQKTYYVYGYASQKDLGTGGVTILPKKPTANELVAVARQQPQSYYFDDQKTHRYSIIGQNKKPQIQLNYEMRLGRPMLRGTCQIAGHPEYKYFELGTHFD